jgi:hypothetical protein
MVIELSLRSTMRRWAALTASSIVACSPGSDTGSSPTDTATGGRTVGSSTSGGGGGSTPSSGGAAGSSSAADGSSGDIGTGSSAEASAPRPGDAANDIPAKPPSDAPAGQGPLVPSAGALLGLFYGAGTVAATEMAVGRKMAIHLTYFAWTDDFTVGPAANDIATGRIPLVNWEPYTGNLDDIIAGVYDTMIHARAAGAKRLAQKFFLDWGAEMNGDWSPWGGALNGQSAAKYLAAYRHIHDIFVADGATNVVWAWCPNVTDEPRETWNAALNYYPGDTYVDWACVDGYNWGSAGGGGWQTFQNLFSVIYPKLATTGKPILIGEMASAEVGGSKGPWIDAMIPTLKTNFPMIRGLVWFDINKETDWRIDSSPAALEAFTRMANDPYMNP